MPDGQQQQIGSSSIYLMSCESGFQKCLQICSDIPCVQNLNGSEKCHFNVVLMVNVILYLACLGLGGGGGGTANL